jgi:hypothetical protein
VEIAKFVLTAIGTFISVSGLSFAVFQFWAKRRDEKDAIFKHSVREDIEAERKQSLAGMQQERAERKEAVERLSKKIDILETSIMQTLQNRIGNMEGELKSMREILKAIQNWFITNTPAGGK